MFLGIVGMLTSNVESELMELLVGFVQLLRSDALERKVSRDGIEALEELSMGEDTLRNMSGLMVFGFESVCGGASCKEVR